nr:MAG TPA: hypothetical protein [Caudoviricetes sp.]
MVSRFFILFLHNLFLVNSIPFNNFPSTYLLPTFIPYSRQWFYCRE